MSWEIQSDRVLNDVCLFFHLWNLFLVLKSEHTQQTHTQDTHKIFSLVYFTKEVNLRITKCCSGYSYGTHRHTKKKVIPKKSYTVERKKKRNCYYLNVSEERKKKKRTLAKYSIEVVDGC